MRKILKFSLIISLALFFSCQQEEELQLDDNASNKPLTEIEKKLEALHFNINGVTKIDFLLPDGSTQEMYQVEEDIVLSEEQIINMKMDGELGSKQFHSNNLVAPGNYTIVGYIGDNVFGLSNKAKIGLLRAVNNYNQLNLAITLQLSFDTNLQNADLAVYNDPNRPGSGSKSGYPNFLKPYKWIKIFGMDGFTKDANEHVLTHAIGHSFGLRHTDWANRLSCGGFQNEGAGNIGANWIPGTPTYYDPTSLMLACFDPNTNGEFNNNDIIALNYLY